MKRTFGIGVGPALVKGSIAGAEVDVAKIAPHIRRNVWVSLKAFNQIISGQSRESPKFVHAVFAR